ALCKKNKIEINIPYNLVREIVFCYNNSLFKTININDSNYDKISKTINFINNEKTNHPSNLKKIFESEDNVEKDKKNIEFTTDKSKVEYITKHGQVFNVDNYNLTINRDKSKPGEAAMEFEREAQAAQSRTRGNPSK
ncbi:hypothetical protein JZU68_06230, partial [bacterium]|nr:hypothetical protein [bacterium]